ncbi:MAG: acyl-CoA ligase (AMP-forming), exosortase A system-associated [Betaproteobacteria bacterium]|nr:acyl-CoA ligase (AMP-forming), exosortase A system-associated [Gammaproteobacteria bacterium]MDH3436820.1 acyl-CoA ligase (AMP-forming), exosortase A system-associated [Betaproteobacteria bacterium]
MAVLLHELVQLTADKTPGGQALAYRGQGMSYGALTELVDLTARAILALGFARQDRLAVYLEKRPETVAAMFGAAAAGGVFVPVNPVLKATQVTYILKDCNVRILVTSPERLSLLAESLKECEDLRAVIIVGSIGDTVRLPSVSIVSWEDAIPARASVRAHRVIDTDMTAILYTSGSTGKPKGVVLSHRNMVAGARSVAQYLENRPDDRILSALPLSFDAGFSQLTTAFYAGASVTLINYLLPRDIITAVEQERITGLTAVPPLWIQLAQLEWPEAARGSLRYIANTGGRMPRATLDALRAALPKMLVFLMYGLTESFRSTYLPPMELDRRPDSIGKAIPNAEVLVVREDGTPCAPGEPGELVHRGALVSLGYWNDPEKTAERFKPAPGQPEGLVMPEIAVWSGDTVRRDEDGFLYFISRHDEMIKTSGYRVSPTEVEEVIYATKLVGEAAALGIPHPVLGQAIVVVVTARDGVRLDTEELLAQCRQQLPAFMVPARVMVREGSLPRNPNGKIDRKLLAQELQDLFEPPMAADGRR